MSSTQSKEFLGKGWKFPISVDDASNSISVSEHEQNIRESILVILGTAKGERVMRPDFGCGIHDHVFDVVNVSTLGQIESSVKEALERWEPRIETIDVNTSSHELDRGKIAISIDYKVRTTNNEFNLVYPFYLTEGIGKGKTQ